MDELTSSTPRVGRRVRGSQEGRRTGSGEARCASGARVEVGGLICKHTTAVLRECVSMRRWSCGREGGPRAIMEAPLGG